MATAIASGRLDNVIAAGRRGRSETTKLLGALAQMQGAIQDQLDRINAPHVQEEAQRAAVDEIRRKTEITRAETQSAQEIVVSGLASALERLAEGDLTFRLNHEFTSDYEQLRGNFNNAMVKVGADGARHRADGLRVSRRHERDQPGRGRSQARPTARASPARSLRKQALCFTVGLFALLVTLSLGFRQTAPTTLAEVAEPDGLRVYRSRNGELSVTLVAQSEVVHVGGLDMQGSTYNVDYAGPVLHVRPGDMLRARLVKHLDLPTNLHFHGLRTSPLGNGDNVHLIVAPGRSLTYEMRVPPDQLPGVYWYHAHPLFVFKDRTFDDDTGDPTIDDELHGIVACRVGLGLYRLTAGLVHPRQRQIRQVELRSTEPCSCAPRPKAKRAAP